MQLVHRKLALALTAVTLFSCGGAQETAGILTTVRAICKLTPNELKSLRNVHLRGTVTYGPHASAFYFMADQTGGIRLDLFAPGKTSATYGDEVDVTGIAAAGPKSPVVARAQITVIGKGRVPDPEQARGPDLDSGRYENKMVTVSGVLMSSQLSDEESRFESRELRVRVDKGTAVVRIENSKRWGDAPIDGGVRVTGVATSMVDAHGVTTRSVIWAAEQGAVEFTSKPAPATSLPVRQVKELLAMDIAKLPSHRIRLQGKLIIAPNSTVLDDDTGRILVRGEFSLDNLPPRVDFAGFLLANSTGGLTIQDASPTFTPETSAAAQVRTPRPLMTSAQSIHRLAPRLANTQFPVRLTGVVTFHDLRKNLLFVQDASDGIFVWAKNLERQLNAGDLVRVDGVTNGKGFAPYVGGARVTSLGGAPLPPPARGMEEEAFQGHLDSRWLEMHGVVQSVAENILTLAWGMHTFQAQVYQPSRSLASLTGAAVVVYGVSSALTNKRRQFLGLTMQVQSERQIHVIRPGPGDPFLIPVKFAVDLLAFSPVEAADRRARVRGVVTLAEPGGTLWLRDASGGVQIRPRSTSVVVPGDVIDASGLPVAGEYSVTLRDADIRRIGSGPRPEPLHFDPAAGFRAEMDAQLVRIDATLLNDASGPDGPVMLLQSGSIPFQARVVAATDEGGSLPPPGSLLRLVGVYSVEPAENSETMTRSFRLIIGSRLDIQILRNVPWWTPARLLGVILLGLFAIVAAVGWVVLLRREVRARVAEAESAAERATTAERNESRQKQVLDLIARHATVESIARHLAGAVGELCPGLACAVLISRREKEQLVAATEIPAELERRLERFGATEILAGRRPRALSEASSEPAVCDPPSVAVNGKQPWFYLSFPVVVGGEIRGSINLFAAERERLDRVAPDMMVAWVNLTAMTIERHDLHDRLSFRATHDPLTELPNRLAFAERLESEIARSKDAVQPFALCYIDLDKFKSVNDTLGHDAGDTVLKEIAERIRGFIRPSDTAARLGGDEFIVMTPAIGGRVNAEEFAAQLTACLQRPILAGRCEVNVGASIGVSLFPEDGCDAETLLRLSDMQMYREKHGRHHRAAPEVSPRDISHLADALELV